MKTDKKQLNDFFNVLRAYKIPCVLDRNKAIETTFYTTILYASYDKRDSNIWFCMPDSLCFNVNLYLDCRIDVSLSTKTTLLDKPSETYGKISQYSKRWHYFNDLYSRFFKSRIESINANVNKQFTDEDIEYLHANQKMLKSDYDMLQDINSL